MMAMTLRERIQSFSSVVIHQRRFFVVFYFVALLPTFLTTEIDSCYFDQFRCHTDGDCIRLAFRCNGETECDDGSDEQGCDKIFSDNFLLVSVARESNSSVIRPHIHQIDVATGDWAPVRLPTPPVVPASLAIDILTKTVFYVDLNVNMIASFSLVQPNNSFRVIFRDSTGQTELDGLALNSATQKLYFSSGSQRGQSEIVELGLSHQRPQRTVISGPNMKPKAIVIDEANSELYWTDWGSFPGISVIGLEIGAVRKILISTNIVTPNALSIDFKEGIMYWVDADLNRIECSKLNGNDRVTLLSERQSHYYSMTISQQHLYITDWKKRYVRKFDRRSYVISDQAPVLDGIKTGLIFYSSNFSNVGRRRLDRENISALLENISALPPSTVSTIGIQSTVMQMTSKAPPFSTIPESSSYGAPTESSSYRAPTESSAYRAPTDNQMTYTISVKDDQKQQDSEQGKQIEGKLVDEMDSHSRTTVVVVLVITGACLFVIIFPAITIWIAMRKRRSASITSSVYYESTNLDGIQTNSAAINNSYEQLPDPVAATGTDEWYDTLDSTKICVYDDTA